VTQGAGSNQTVSETVNIDEAKANHFAEMKSGDTLVFAGYEQVTNNANLSGVGSPLNTLMGSERGKNTRDTIVITITAAIQDAR
jgi:hypothetical protein